MRLPGLFIPLGILAIIGLTACSIISPPEGPVIPPPPAPAPSVVNFSDLELIVNPESSVAPAVDPEIAALVNAVSEQQLIAYVQTLENFGTRNTFSETQRDDLGIGAARRWIHDEFLRVNGGALQVGFDDYPINIDGRITNQRNVVATLPGISDHHGAIVISAHYDSRPSDPLDGNSPAPGANDNASGVAILLELARLLSSRPWNHTIIFVAFSAEEQGNFGSRHFVQDSMLGGRIFDAVINNDIVGGRPGIPQSIRAFSPGPNTSASRQLARYLDLIGRQYNFGLNLDIIDGIDREGRWSDHREFINAGVPGVRLTESEEDRSSQHSGGDTAEKLDYGYLRQVAQLNLAVLANLVGALPAPNALTVAHMGEGGSYNLKWQPDPRAAGYAISFRSLDSEQFPPFRFVSGLEAGNVAYTDLDDQIPYAVSIAAIDANGRIGAFTPEILIGPAG